MSPGTSRGQPPTGLIEILRLFTVVFFAGLGYETAQFLGDKGHSNVLGPFNGLAIAIIVGSGLGYVVGGVLGRTVAATADRTEVVLREVSADTLVAGALGLVCGVLTGAGIAWPLFFVPRPPHRDAAVRPRGRRARLPRLPGRVRRSATGSSRSSAGAPASTRAPPWPRPCRR